MVWVMFRSRFRCHLIIDCRLPVHDSPGSRSGTPDSAEAPPVLGPRDQSSVGVPIVPVLRNDHSYRVNQKS